MAQGTRSAFGDIVIPVVDYQDETQASAERAPRPKNLQGKTIALLPNDRPLSPAFMQALAKRLTQETSLKRALKLDIPVWPFNHPVRAKSIQPELDQLARRCDLLVTGVGD